MNRITTAKIATLSVLIVALTFSFVLIGARNVNAEDEVTFYHDNPEWQERWVELGELSQNEIGIGLDVTEFKTDVYKSRVKTDLTSPRAPEIFKWWFGYRAQQLVDAGLVADLSDVWEEVGDKVSPGIREQLTIDGMTYAVPLHSSYWVWYYNENLYEKYDMNPPETWQEFMDQAEFFQEKGINFIGNTVGESRWTSFIVFQELLLHKDHQFYKELMAGEAHWTDKEVVETMKQWKTLLDEGYFAPMDSTYVQDYPRMFKNNELALIPMGTWYSGILMDRGLEPGKDFNVFVLPAISEEGEGALATEISPLMVGKRAANKEKAKDWLKWWVSDEDARKLDLDLWHPMPWDTIISEDAVAETNPEFAKLLQEVDNYPNKAIRFWEATPTEIVNHAVAEFERMLTKPNQWEKVLKSIENQAAKTWPDYDVDYEKQPELEK
ncbi:MAG: extracellular solute-binding protein [Candidatus Bipolaricaulota bacterium]|nr:extracellular solute-binding protein [Candidatus Bipolaricaulota bacterium]